jgi:hypothetical protein
MEDEPKVLLAGRVFLEMANLYFSSYPLRI